MLQVLSSSPASIGYMFGKSSKPSWHQSLYSRKTIHILSTMYLYSALLWVPRFKPMQNLPPPPTISCDVCQQRVLPAGIKYSKCLFKMIFLQTISSQMLKVSTVKGWAILNKNNVRIVLVQGWVWSPTTSKCYKGFNSSSTWMEASTSCQNGGGVLAEHQNNASLYSALEAINLQSSPGEYWIGGKKSDGSSNYIWTSDNSALNNDQWGPGYPLPGCETKYFRKIHLFINRVFFDWLRFSKPSGRISTKWCLLWHQRFCVWKRGYNIPNMWMWCWCSPENNEDCGWSWDRNQSISMAGWTNSQVWQYQLKSNWIFFSVCV